MSHVPFTLLAYFLNGIAVLVDKFLLTSKITNPLIYVFYISLVSLLIIVLIPFTVFPSLLVLILASLSTIIWTSGLIFMYLALKEGLVTRVIPVIGTLIPIFLLVDAIYTKSITNMQIIAVLILVLGLIFLTIFEWRGKIAPREVAYILLSSFLFAVSYIFLREAYLRANFFTVLVWSRIVLVPLGFLIIIIPKGRRMVFGNGGSSFSLLSKQGLLFMGGQAAGGSSELLLTFSVSLANPALVNSLQGSQYLFIFAASIFLAKKFPGIFAEEHTLLKSVLKISGIICIAVGLYIIAFYK